MVYLILPFFPDFHKMRCYQTRHFDKEFKNTLFASGLLRSGDVFYCLLVYNQPFSIINQGLDGKNLIFVSCLVTAPIITRIWGILNINDFSMIFIHGDSKSTVDKTTGN